MGEALRSTDNMKSDIKHIVLTGYNENRGEAVEDPVALDVH